MRDDYIIDMALENKFRDSLVRLCREQASQACEAEIIAGSVKEQTLEDLCREEQTGFNTDIITSFYHLGATGANRNLGSRASILSQKVIDKVGCGGGGSSVRVPLASAASSEVKERGWHGESSSRRWAVRANLPPSVYLLGLAAVGIVIGVGLLPSLVTLGGAAGGAVVASLLVYSYLDTIQNEELPII